MRGMILTVPVSITQKRVRELIKEAGSAYWAKDLKWARSSAGAGVQRGGLTFSIVEHDDGPEKLHRVSTEDVIAGLTKMANAKSDEGGHHFQAVLDDCRSDMWTGDAIIQFAVFGELKYG